MRRIIGTATAALGLAALVFAGAPATAATLPVTDATYILPCDDNSYNGELFRVDPTTGVATRVGSWVNPDPAGVYNCAGPAAYDPADGKGYWISWANSHGYLIQVDLNTGVSTEIGEFAIGGVPYDTPISIAIDSTGAAWATSFNTSPDTLYSLDLTTAALTVVGPTGIAPESENYGLAWDPVTHAVYAYNPFGDDFYTVDLTTGAFTVFNDNVFLDVEPFAIAFDSLGQVWGINGDIISAPLADLDNSQTLTVINPTTGGDDTIYSESIIIAPAPPAPVLAQTGLNESGSMLIAGFGALLVVGGIVVARRRRTA